MISSVNVGNVSETCRNRQAQSPIVESLRRRRARRPVLLHLALLMETDTDLHDVVSDVVSD